MSKDLLGVPVVRTLLEETTAGSASEMGPREKRDRVRILRGAKKKNLKSTKFKSLTEQRTVCKSGSFRSEQVQKDPEATRGAG